MMAEKSSENANNRNSYGSVKSMKSLNMYKQFIQNLYLIKISSCISHEWCSINENVICGNDGS